MNVRSNLMQAFWICASAGSRGGNGIILNALTKDILIALRADDFINTDIVWHKYHLLWMVLYHS